MRGEPSGWGRRTRDVLAIAAAWLLLEFGGFVLGLILAAFSRWKEDRDIARALKWWGCFTADQQAQWLERIGRASEHLAGVGCSPSGAALVMRHLLRSRVPATARAASKIVSRLHSRSLPLSEFRERCC